MTFWLVAALIAIAVAGILALTLWRKRDGVSPAAAFDLKVYRDQLREVERDLARGMISEEDAERTRLEVSRRILEADAALQKSPVEQSKTPASTRILALLSFTLIIGGSLGLYMQIGAPGYPDMPLQARKDAAEEVRVTRMRQAEAEGRIPASPALKVDPRHQEMVEELRRIVTERPEDQQGFQLLARNEAALGNFREGYAAQSRLIELKGEEATGTDFAILADMMIMATNGYVSPEAEAALNQALTKSPKEGSSRFYLGLMYAQVGRHDFAFRIWNSLLQDSTPDAPWVPAIRDGIEDLAYRAGVEFTLPPLAPAPRGPSAQDVEAAADMTPEERNDMIRGMVEGLSERLATEGGSPQEWSQLIVALGMLGETDRASAIWAEAQQVFAESEDALAQVNGAAAQIGLSQ